MEAANYISYTIQVGVPSKEEKDIQGLFALDGGSVILSLGKRLVLMSFFCIL